MFSIDFRTNTSRLQYIGIEISGVHHKRDDFIVQGSVLWPFDNTPGLHPGLDVGSPKGHLSTLLSG